MANEEQGSGELREIPIEWEALEDAFENNAPEVHSYLHLRTGEVLRVVDGIADPEMHARIAADPNYLRIESVSSREQYRWMERFIQMNDDTPLRDSLKAAIDGKGAFRRFKDVLMAHATERERWFAFRSERLRVFMEAWLTAHALQAVPREAWKGTEAAPHDPDDKPISQDQISGRRGRTAEVLRQQLLEIAETLGPRDLEKLTTFAEFVKARRASRSLAPRTEPSPSASPAGSGATSADIDDPPSSRKLSTVR